VTYLLFDLLAVATPAGLLLLRARRRRTIVVPVTVLAAVAALWTAPWDRHLVRSSVWSYDPAAVLGLWGSVPVEEFGFIVLQVVLIAAWMLHAGGLTPRPGMISTRTPTLSGAAVWLGVGLLGGALLLLGGHLRYLGLLLVWVAPPFCVQHALAHDVLVSQRTGRLLRAVPVALWLCLCDRVALALGIWTISPASSTGLAVGGLPVEEALFFWLTCLLTSDGLLLIADPVVLARVRALLPKSPVPR
jgi:lycopene cyclase domain-containing protein